MEPGLRSVETGWLVVRALDALGPRLTTDNRVQLRWETFCAEAEPLIDHVLATRDRPALAFNDHTTAMLLHPDVALQDRPFDQIDGYPVTPLDAPRFVKKMQDQARRAHIPAEDYIALIRCVWDRRPEVPARIARIAATARGRGIPMLSHDDSPARNARLLPGAGGRG